MLGIETSCDETAVAVVDDAREVRASLVYSQLDEHRPFGGVVPEIAARSHLARLDGLIAQALDEAGIGFAALDGVAATGGPGLIGGVMVGIMAAKAIALVRDIPLVAVNHMEAHALTPRLTDDVDYPYLALLISGGHCQLVAVAGVGRYTRYGTTVDDAVGEAFDKAAKLLGLGYPGGPEIERAAKDGRAGRFDLPRPMIGREGCDFSFSGLKTAMRHQVAKLPPGGPGATEVADLAAGFETAVAEVLADRTGNALERFREEFPAGNALVAAGGVAANTRIRRSLLELATDHGLRFVAPPPALCTDNAAMVAWAGIERLGAGLTDGLDFAPRPRWPLDEMAA